MCAKLFENPKSSLRLRRWKSSKLIKLCLVLCENTLQRWCVTKWGGNYSKGACYLTNATKSTITTILRKKITVFCEGCFVVFETTNTIYNTIRYIRLLTWLSQGCNKNSIVGNKVVSSSSTRHCLIFSFWKSVESISCDVSASLFFLLSPRYIFKKHFVMVSSVLRIYWRLLVWYDANHDHNEDDDGHNHNKQTKMSKTKIVCVDK